MLKRVGVLALVLSAGAAFLQPATAFAEDRYRAGGDRHDQTIVHKYREPVHREIRDRVRVVRRSDQYYYAPAPNYYYAPAPICR